ncbi:MAG TPA: protein translocase subunit SecF [Elusimicrobiota bacterium]|nr:protein translocase subunit SecF [Elusimicrobiota bacterium]
MEIFHKPNIDFIGLRWYPIGASILVVTIGLAAIAIKGFNYSIEFTGGSLIQVSFPAGAKTNVDAVRKALEKEHLDADVQSVEADHPTFILREKSTADEATVTTFSDKTMDVLEKAFPDSKPSLDRKDVIGPVVGKDLRRRTLWAIVLSLFAIILYVAYQFENPIWGIAGVIALFHDVIGVAGIFALLGLQVDLLIVTALLTIAGYSISDTIVIFDRMREKMRTERGLPLDVLINASMNETLSRTVITVLIVQIVCVVLWLAGGPVLRDFAFAMVIGNIFGTYSSIGVAAPLVFEHQVRFGGKKVSSGGSGASGGSSPSVKVKEGRRRS